VLPSPAGVATERNVFGAGALAAMGQGKGVGSQADAGEDSDSADTRNLNLKQGAVYIPESKLLLCMCLKCGTTSLYQYMFGALHSQTWCEYKQTSTKLSPHRDANGDPMGGCDGAGVSTAAAVEMLSLGPGVDPAEGRPEPAESDRRAFLIDLPPGGEAERDLEVSLHPLAEQDEQDEQDGDAHQVTLDLTEDIHQKFWGKTFQKGGFRIAMWEDDSVYTHAIVRDPVERLISAYVNKLSCGLYSVPAGQKGDGSGDQEQWSGVVEDAGYKDGFMNAAEGKTKTLHYQCPCLKGPWLFGNTPVGFKDRADCLKNNFTACSCEGVTLEMFADGIEKIYKAWPKYSGEPGKSKPHHQLNAHFTPQTGQNSCFQNVDIKDYDKVSVISDLSAMRKFSKHLPAHKHGLWSGKASNAHGNLYFEGKPWHVPHHIVQKLTKATAAERKYLQDYL